MRCELCVLGRVVVLEEADDLLWWIVRVRDRDLDRPMGPYPSREVASHVAVCVVLAVLAHEECRVGEGGDMEVDDLVDLGGDE